MIDAESYEVHGTDEPNAVCIQHDQSDSALRLDYMMQ